jgi:hypothetical protein
VRTAATTFDSYPMRPRLFEALSSGVPKDATAVLMVFDSDHNQYTRRLRSLGHPT